jgi:glutathione S-transferase
LVDQLEDLGQGKPLLPSDPKQRAYSRLWTDHINRKIVPLFYKYLQAQTAPKQTTHYRELQAELDKLVEAADPEGPFFLGSELGFVDVQVAPWVIRLRTVLWSYRGWPNPRPGSRWAKWVKAIEQHPSVMATTSDDTLYVESYERYARESFQS